MTIFIDAKKRIDLQEIEISGDPLSSPSKYLCKHIPMPGKSHFTGLEPPSDAIKWGKAIEDACVGRLVLLDKALHATGNRSQDIYRGGTQHMWTHDMGDKYATNKVKIGAAVESYYKNDPMATARAPIIHLGHRNLNRKGDFKEFASKNLCEFQDNIPGKMVAIGCMDSNWGYLSTNMLNRCDCCSAE
jgi:hypothetical protein